MQSASVPLPSLLETEESAELFGTGSQIDPLNITDFDNSQVPAGLIETKVDTLLNKSEQISNQNIEILQILRTRHNG